MSKLSSAVHELRSKVEPTLDSTQAWAVAEWERSGRVRRRWISAGVSSVVTSAVWVAVILIAR